MGIPKFFKWLTRRYPQVLLDIKREEQVPPIDNLYLDLNGIVHNCIHGNDAKLHERVSQLDNFEEVWINIMKAIDELVHTIKPKKLLFLAVDGVAPRAKMNQQRARRFRTAKDSQLLREKLQKEGKEAPALFDSNAISPGTKFMEELSRQLDFFVQYKQNTDPLYQNLERVILSDAFVPGEGEHKMMDYIRQAKHDPNYDPNTRHCFYGADADLIMLSLLTHEPNFIILREEHVVRKIKQGGVQRLDLKRTNNYQVMFINLLREYFLLEYRTIAPKMKMRFDLERIIDDFIFFCFFIGNDFLPSLSALDIGEGSLDSIIDLYKRLLPSMENYITEEGRIYWDRAEPFIKMLGEHEHESFKNRVSKIGAMRDERLISFDPEFNQAQTTINRTQLIQQRIREKLNEKKRKKILGLCQKKKDKQTKKFLLLKRFEEDEINQSLTMKQRQIRDTMLIKYKRLRDKQREDTNIQSQGEPVSEESKAVESIKELISGLKEEYFSDLNVEDIDDEEVSEISESEINLDDIQDQNLNSELENKVKVTLDQQDKYEQQNFEFMQEFIKIYQHEPERAKAMYYRAKLHFDITNMEGKAQKRKMLMKYLEGLQWVLYYYYRGAQHWRWYYPYHYAPMISDLEENIVTTFLGGKHYIDQFEIDHNCAEVNEPYTPFQQLLSILPIKSLHLLPQQYAKIVLGELRQFFPDDFDIDLNGRTLTYEAACLIPFCDEKLFIQHEQNLHRECPLHEHDHPRNIVTFEYKCYTYDHLLKANQVIRPLPLESTLSSFKGLEHNYVKVTLNDEYRQVGKFQFEAKLLKGLKQPCHDFPSFTYLNIQEVTYDEKVMHEVAFQRVLLKVPPTREDIATEYLENYVNGFIKLHQKEIYVDFPFQYEAFPTFFENKEFTYTVYGDDVSQVYKIHKDRQGMDEEKFDMMRKRSIYKLQDMGFDIGESPNVFVSFNRITDVSFDSRNNQYYKVYSQDQELLPLSMVTRRRDPYHYLNVNLRCAQYTQSFKPNRQVVCLNTHFFGVIGKVQQIDLKNKKIKVQFDKREEQNKIHDPFMGQKCLQNKDNFVPLNTRRYYSDHMIEQELKLKSGVVNRLTGSLLVTFNDRQKYERQVIDLGLNLKNFTKKAHIPDFVRYVVDEDVADNQFDDYNHNYHARGAKHVRKHWEYSEECLEIIREYQEKYGFIIDVIVKTMRSNKQMLTLKDIFGKNTEESTSQQTIKEIANWIEKLPTSNLPYVEMGFDALNSQLIQIINDQSKLIKETYRKVQLKCQEVEILDPSYLFQEQFPYWSLPFNSRTVNDYRIGDRVMNVKSVKREYMPFGLRGTVVGKTNDKVIVMFDEQFLNGNNIYGHCENYRGGFIEPNHLINLTKRFNSIMNSNLRVAQSFQERPVGEELVVGDEGVEVTEQYNPEDEQDQQRDDSDPSRKWTDVNQKPKVIRNQKPANIMLNQVPSQVQQRQQQHQMQQIQQRQGSNKQQEELKSMDDGVEFKQVYNNRGQNRGQQNKQWYNKDTPQYQNQRNRQPQYQPRNQQQQQQKPQYQAKQQQQQQQQQQQPLTTTTTTTFVEKSIQQQEQQIQGGVTLNVAVETTTTTVVQQEENKGFEQQQLQQQQQHLTGFVPSQNQMRDYFYDDNEDDYYQEQDQYYQEQPDQRVEEEADLNNEQAMNQLNALQNNPDFQQLLNMMNIAQQMQGPLNLLGQPGGFANAPNPFANMFAGASDQQPLDPNAQEFSYQPPTKQNEEEEKKDSGSQ